MTEYLAVLSSSISGAFSTLTSFFEKLNATSFFLSFFVMIIAFRFILVPMFGSSIGSIFNVGSDPVRVRETVVKDDKGTHRSISYSRSKTIYKRRRK